MKKYVLDSNIISYILKKDVEVIKKFRQANDNGDECIIPAIVFYEITRGLLSVGATTKMRDFSDLCDEFGIAEITISVWREAARIYSILKKRGTLIEDSDIFIAAFCIVNDYVLVTNNTRHFEVVDGLNFINWK